ncbi:MAG: (d)CMP kinase [Firmicutes bacterium]|nr:(d)CMP kinase [Bacillota bacterium]
MSNNIIAIDGPVASGKGTIARLLSAKLGWKNLSTGDIYRGISVHMMRSGVDPFDKEQVIKCLNCLDMRVLAEGGETLVFLGDEQVNGQLHSIETSKYVYKVALLPEVRECSTRIQKRIAAEGNLVCEGRDIGSVVFPNAKYKFYLDASADERAKRRWLQDRLQDPTLTIEKVKDGIQRRDLMDMNRSVSPLIIAEGAIVIDGNQTPDKIVEDMLNHIKSYQVPA